MGIEYSGSRATPRMELGAAVMEFVEQQNEFIGTQILPIFRTKKKESTFAAITRESITREADTKRAPRGNYNRDGFAAKDLSYKCEEHGLEGALDDGERAMYASDFDAELVTTKITTRRVLLAQERRIAASIFSTSTFTGAALYTDISGSAPWTTVGSDAIKAVRDGREKVRQNTGIEPNALIISKANRDRLLSNTGVKAAIQYVARTTEAEIMNALADILGVKRIIIGGAIYNSAKEGKAFVSADVWSPLYAMLAVVASDGQNLADPSIGRTFLWETDSPDNAVVEQYRDEGARSDIFRVRQHVDEIVVDAYFGHMLKVSLT